MHRRKRSQFLALLTLLAAAIWVACDRKHDPDDFSPTAPGVADALVLSTSNASITADGSSTTEIVARLSPEAAPGRRVVEFTTSTGAFVGAATSTPNQMQVEAVLGEARATLRSSSKVETAFIQARVKEGDKVLATAQLQVQFIAGGLQTIQLAASRTSIPADGFSRSELVATLSPDTPSDRRTVVFTATRGTLVNGSGSPSTLEVVAGRDNQARAELVSSKTLETAIVTATLKDVPGATDSLTVRFDPPDSSTLISISTSRREVPADGATVIQVHADIAASIPEADRTVTFTSTAGTFLNSPTPLQATARADASNRATVDLKAGTEIVTAVLRAAASVASAETTVELVRAFPDDIQVDFGTATSLKADGTSSVTVTARLLRDVGTVTDGTVVEFSAVDAATLDPVPLLFRNVQRSTNGEATALVIAPAATERTTVTVRALVELEDGTPVTGEANIEIVD